LRHDKPALAISPIDKNAQINYIDHFNQLSIGESMEILNATDAKREFGDVLLKAQKEPIAINKNGKTVAVVMSAVDYQTLTNQQESLLKIELQKGMDDLQAGRVADGNTVIERLKNRVINAPL